MTDRDAARKAATMIKPRLLVGKSGVTPGVIAELDRILEKEEVVKVKFLRSSDLALKEQMMAELSKGTSSELLGARGNTVTLFRPSQRPSGKIYKSKSGASH